MVPMMHRFDPGAGKPEQWTPVDVAAILGIPVYVADEAYSIMSDEDWREYCQEIARVKFGQH